MHSKSYEAEPGGDLFKMQQEAAVAQAREMRARARELRPDGEDRENREENGPVPVSETETKTERVPEELEIAEVKRAGPETSGFGKISAIDKIFNVRGFMGRLVKRIKLDDIILFMVILLLMSEEADDDLILILAFVFISGF